MPHIDFDKLTVDNLLCVFLLGAMCLLYGLVGMFADSYTHYTITAASLVEQKVRCLFYVYVQGRHRTNAIQRRVAHVPRRRVKPTSTSIAFRIYVRCYSRGVILLRLILAAVK